jgi:hypothetical protein
MRPPSCAPNAISVEATPHRGLRARGATAQSTRSPRQGGKAGPRNANHITLPARDSPPLVPQVIDDLPDVVPVGPQELDAIQTYLGAVLDELLVE